MSSHRLQVLIPEELQRRIRKAAQRRRLSRGAWVRQAIERYLAADADGQAGDPVERLAQLAAPTGDIDRLLAEIEAGRG